MAVYRAPCDGDGQIVGSCLRLDATENAERNDACEKLGQRRHFQNAFITLEDDYQVVLEVVHYPCVQCQRGMITLTEW